MKNQDGLRITIPRASEGLRSRFRRLHPARKLPGLKMPKKGEGMERWERRKIWPAVMFIFYSRLDWLDVSDSDHCTGRFPKFWSLIHGFFWEVLSSLLSVSRCDALQSYDWGEEWPYADLGFYMVATASGNGNTSREVLNIIASSLSLDPGRFKVLTICSFGKLRIMFLASFTSSRYASRFVVSKWTSSRTGRFLLGDVGWRFVSSTWNLITDPSLKLWNVRFSSGCGRILGTISIAP